MPLIPHGLAHGLYRGPQGAPYQALGPMPGYLGPMLEPHFLVAVLTISWSPTQALIGGFWHGLSMHLSLQLYPASQGVPAVVAKYGSLAVSIYGPTSPQPVPGPGVSLPIQLAVLPGL